MGILQGILIVKIFLDNPYTAGMARRTGRDIIS
jgi:hypothetical protein